LTLVGESKSASTYNYAIYKVRSGNDTAFIRAPEVGSELGNKSTITITVCNNNITNLSLVGWGKTSYISPSEGKDSNFYVSPSDSKLILSSSLGEIFRIPYTIVSYIVYQNDTDLLNKTTERMPEPEPKSELWTPFTFGTILFMLMVLSIGFSFLLTRVSLLINWLSPINVWVIIGFSSMTALNLIYTLFTNGSTQIENTIAQAYFAMRELVLVSFITSWFLGVGFARYSIGLHFFWKFDIRTRTIFPLDGIIYDGPDGKEKFAHQTLKAAWRRLRGFHSAVIWLKDISIARHDWTFKDLIGEITIQIVNDYKILDNGDVLIDCSGKSLQTYRLKDSTGKIRVVNVTSDFTDIGHILGCNIHIQSIPEWIQHCDTLQLMTMEYDHVTEEKARVENEFLVAKNRAYKGHMELLNGSILDLSFGETMVATTDEAKAKKKGLIEEALAIKKERENPKKKVEEPEG
jgi:hypothetical protein